jgi:hypothetical protein
LFSNNHQILIEHKEPVPLAGAGLLSTGGWFVLREKYCWLVADKPSEQGERNTMRYDAFLLIPITN